MKKILLISCGSIGRRHLKNCRELLPGSRLAVYRLHNRNTQDLPEGADHVFFSQEEALKFQPDAVVISSPANDHVQNALDFLRNGAHLFIEKPLAMSSLDVEELVVAEKESTKFHMVGYVLRFQPILSFLKNILDIGQLGDVYTGHVQVGQYLPDWRPGADYRKGVSACRDLGGGVLLELSHEIDYATWMFGMPDEVTCSASKLSSLEIDVEDSASVIMDYGKKHRRVVVNLDFLQRAAHMSLQVVGSKATLFADLIKEEAFLSFAEGKKNLSVPKLSSGNEMYLKQFDYFFANAFKSYQPRYAETAHCKPYVSIGHAAEVLKIVDLARLSASKGQRMAMNG